MYTIIHWLQSTEAANGGVIGNSCSYLSADKYFSNVEVQKYYFLEQFDFPDYFLEQFDFPDYFLEQFDFPGEKITSVRTHFP